MTEPYKPTESELAEREEMKAKLRDILRQAEELQAQIDKLETMPDKVQPEQPDALKRH